MCACCMLEGFDVLAMASATRCSSVLQCVAVCCSVSQCVALCCSVLQCATVCCSVLQCVAVCCSVLQCVAVCWSALQCVEVLTMASTRRCSSARFSDKWIMVFRQQSRWAQCCCLWYGSGAGECGMKDGDSDGYIKCYIATHCNTLQHTAKQHTTLIYHTVKARWWQW